MTEEQAFSIVDVFRKLTKKHGLWMTIETEEKPELKMIRIKEISIKIDKV